MLDIRKLNARGSNLMRYQVCITTDPAPTTAFPPYQLRRAIHWTGVIRINGSMIHESSTTLVPRFLYLASLSYRSFIKFLWSTLRSFREAVNDYFSSLHPNNRNSPASDSKSAETSPRREIGNYFWICLLTRIDTNARC